VVDLRPEPDVTLSNVSADRARLSRTSALSPGNRNSAGVRLILPNAEDGTLVEQSGVTDSGSGHP
jgi:hypothetical protein